jgi:hypothetical protein
MLVSGCSNATGGGFKRPRPNSFRRGEPRERGAPVMRRRGFEPPPTKCGPGPHFVTRLSDPSHASRTSDASADLDRLDVIDDLDVAADVATAAALAAKATLDSPVAAPLLCMDRNSPPVTAAFHGCRSGTASDRARAGAWSTSKAAGRAGCSMAIAWRRERSPAPGRVREIPPDDRDASECERAECPHIAP